MPLKYLLFDFDGVIVDTFDISYESGMGVFATPVTKDEYRKFFYGNIYDNKMVTDGLEAPRSAPTEKDAFFLRYVPRLLEQPPIEGMRDILASLASHHTLVIVSSSINSPIQKYLDRYNLAEFFDTVLGADVHTSKVKKIQMVFEMYSTTPEQCLFITDTLGDMREATKAGLRSVGVSWGFHDAETLRQGDPLGIATTPRELHQLIDSLRA